MYGMRAAANRWQDEYSTLLVSLGFRQGNARHSRGLGPTDGGRPRQHQPRLAEVVGEEQRGLDGETIPGALSQYGWQLYGQAPTLGP